MIKLRSLRESRRLTLKELEEKTGINFSTLAKLEKGLQTLNGQQAVILADFFHVSLDYLFGRDFSSEKIILKEKEMTYYDYVNVLKYFTDLELQNLKGVLDYIITERQEGRLNRIPRESERVQAKKS